MLLSIGRDCCCPALTCWWSLKRARGAQGSEVDFKRGGRFDVRFDDDITADDPLTTSDWLWRPVSTPRLRSSNSFLSSRRRRSRISVFSLLGGANSDVKPPLPVLLRNSSWEALRLNSVKLTDSSLVNVGSLTIRCRLPGAQGIREVTNKGSEAFDWTLMTLAKAESDSLRRCIIIRDTAVPPGGGVDNPPRPELLPLELLLFSSIGSSLLRVVAATPTGDVVVEFQLVKNWAKSQSFSIYLRVTGVAHIQNERRVEHTHTHTQHWTDKKRPWAGGGHTQKTTGERRNPLKNNFEIKSHATNEWINDPKFQGLNEYLWIKRIVIFSPNACRMFWQKFQSENCLSVECGNGTFTIKPEKGNNNTDIPTQNVKQQKSKKTNTQ